MSILSLENVSKTYRGPDGEIAALNDFSLTISTGEFVAVRGPSGCGKSTLLLMAGGLLSPDHGVISIDGEDLYAMGSENRAHYRSMKIGFVFQQFHLVPYLSVLDNILVATVQKPASTKNGVLETAHQLIERFGLSARAHHVPSQLSTGERQRTALARALLNRPSLILADEPTGNLDRENADTVLEDLAAFAGDGGAVLLVTHDPVASERADKQVELDPKKQDAH